MNGLRVVLVTHRFWPLVGGAETAMVELVAQRCAEPLFDAAAGAGDLETVEPDLTLQGARAPGAPAEERP